MISDSFINRLPTGAKNWLAIAIGGMIVADGVVDEDELQYLQKALSFLEDHGVINSLVNNVKKKELPPLPQLTISGKEAFHMLKYLAAVAGSDSRFSRSEAGFLKSVGEKLGFDQAFIKEVLNLARMQAKVHREEDRLEKMAQNIHDLA